MNKKCQIFTPENYVEELLDSIDYKKQLYGKKILENSCGDGNILVAIVRRYVTDCKEQGISKTKIKNGLGKDIYGVEIDPEQYEKCIENLNRILNEENINPVNWRIINKDYLRWDFDTKFDFIVGNPPYITYKELKKEEQKYLKTNFLSCKEGKFDYCYAFIEKSVRSLKSNGKMAYLIPSSIFKTVFGYNLRKIIKTFIEEIKDYTLETIFDNALVKSSIMVLNHNRQYNTVHYVDMTNELKLDIIKDELGDKWFFTKNTNNSLDGSCRFGDYFKISHVVATLLNEAYILKEQDYLINGEYYICKGHNIEAEMVRETATPRSLRYGKVEKIIFPYKYINGQLLRYSVVDFESNFPGTATYLNDFRKQLDNRESDKSTKWFEYGRTQALSGLDREKLLVSTVVTESVNVYMLTRECIPYAGMYIVPAKNNSKFTLYDAKRILESRDFMQYVLDVGIHINGNSLRITSKDIADYRF